MCVPKALDGDPVYSIVSFHPGAFPTLLASSRCSCPLSWRWDVATSPMIPQQSHLGDNISQNNSQIPSGFSRQAPTTQNNASKVMELRPFSFFQRSRPRPNKTWYEASQHFVHNHLPSALAGGCQTASKLAPKLKFQGFGSIIDALLVRIRITF